MSTGNLVSLAGGLVGRAVAIGLGASPTGMAIGWAVGSVIANEFFGPKPEYESGKLSDLRYSGSSYGVPWPRVWGKVKVGAQVIWCKKDASGNHLRQESNTSGGKGGKTTTYTTYSTFALGFCRGEILYPNVDDPLDGTFVYRNHQIQKIWAGQELIYDRATGYNKHGFSLWPGTETQAAESIISAAEGANTSAHRGLVGGAVADMDITPHGSTIPTFKAEIQTDAFNLVDIFTDLFRMAGIPPAKFDLSGLVGVTPVTKGVVWDTQDAPRGLIEQLLVVENLDFVEADGVIRITPRAVGTTYNIDANLLGASTGSSTSRLKRKRTRSDDLPSRLWLSFLDPDSDYQSNSVASRRQVYSLINEDTISTKLVISAEDAQKIVDREMDRRWAERVTVEFSLPLGALRFIPGDKLMVPDVRTGEVLRVRLTGQKLQAYGHIALTGVIEDPDVWNQVATGSPGNSSTNSLPVVPSVFVARSVKEVIQDHQTTPGFYVGASGGTGWSGGTVFYKHSAATDYTEGPFIGTRAKFGVSTSALADYTGLAGDLDTSNTVGVNVSASDAILNSVDDTAVDAGTNWAWLGNEVIGFSTATLTGASAYTLSRILRGLKGSVGTGHTSSDPFLVADNSVAHVAVPEAHVGATYNVKVVSPGQTLADVTAINVVIAARTKTATEQALAKVLSPVWITPVDITSSFTFDDTWRSVSLVVVPSDAEAIMLFIEYGNSTGDTSKRRLVVRRGSSADVFTLAASSSGAGGDTTSVGHQATAPVQSAFQYKAPSSWIEKVELVGYMATPS